MASTPRRSGRCRLSSSAVPTRSGGSGRSTRTPRSQLPHRFRQQSDHPYQDHRHTHDQAEPSRGIRSHQPTPGLSTSDTDDPLRRTNRPSLSDHGPTHKVADTPQPVLALTTEGRDLQRQITAVLNQPDIATPPQLTPDRASASKAGTAFQRARRRKSTTRSVVACGCSSVIQCPQSGMIASSTLSATHRITAPIIGPNVASPPKAKTGI